MLGLTLERQRSAVVGQELGQQQMTIMSHQQIKEILQRECMRYSTRLLSKGKMQLLTF